MKHSCLHKMLLVLVFGAFMWPSQGQDQRVADSLKTLYDTGSLEGEARMDLLLDLAYHENRDNALRQSYARELIQLAEEANDPDYIYSGYMQLGNALRKAGDAFSAIEAYDQSLTVARETENEEREGNTIMAIADTYSSIEDRENSVRYYKNSIDLLRKTKSNLEFAIVLFNLGDELIKLGQLDEASGYFDEAEAIFRKESFDYGLVYIQGSRGVITGEMGNHTEGINQIQLAIQQLEEYEDYYAISDYIPYLAEFYAAQKSFDQAIEFGEKGLDLAIKNGHKEQIRDAYKTLYEIYSAMDSKDESMAALQNYYIYRDSIKNIESVQEIATLRYNADMSQKQAEVDLLNQQRSSQRIVLWATGIVALLLCILAIGMYRKNKFVQRTNKIIEAEQNRSESLLLNILPEQTANELKEKGKVAAKKFESVSVLFTDFVDFSKYAEKLDPEKLIKGMDFYYGHFDDIIEKYGLEKIKTVGDSYMCAGGIPNPDSEHAVKIVQAAMDIVDFVERVKADRQKGKTRFDIRIGINSGPLVAGVVGTKKFAYDIWGDTVNVAARMETNSESGRINISEHTYELVKDHFECEFRGEIPAKNKGRLKMYFIKGYLEKGKSSTTAKAMSVQ